MKDLTHITQELREELVAQDESLGAHKKEFLRVFDRMLNSQPVVEQDELFKSQLKDRLQYHLITQHQPAPEISRWQSLLLYGVPGVVLAAMLVFFVNPLEQRSARSPQSEDGEVSPAVLFLEESSSDYSDSLPELQTREESSSLPVSDNTQDASTKVYSSEIGATQDNDIVMTHTRNFLSAYDQDTHSILEHNEWSLSYKLDKNTFQGLLKFKDDGSTYTLFGDHIGTADVDNTTHVISADVLDGDVVLETISIRMKGEEAVAILDRQRVR